MKCKGAFKLRFIGCALIFSGLAIWFWMLGGLAYFTNLTEVMGHQANWIDPGLLTVPVISSLVMLLVGFSTFFIDDNGSKPDGKDDDHGN